jgi:hypothetical protein
MGKGVNKNLSKLAAAQAEVGRDMLAIGKDSLDFSKAQYADSKSELERIRPMLDALATGQIKSTTLANDITSQSWDDYKATYRPIEQRVAADAMAAGTPGEQEAAAGRAGIDVQRAIDINRGATDRSLGSMGVNPNSGRFVGQNRTAAILGAAARAGAETGARVQEKMRGDVLRSAATATGRNMTGTALTGVGVGGQAATIGAGLTGNAGDRKNALGQQFLGNQAGAAGIMGNSAGVLNGAAGTYLDKGNLQLAQAAQSSSAMSSLGSGLGSMAGMAMMFSDENAKTGKRKIRGARKAIDGMRVEGWKYKGDGTDHVGTYAQDFTRETGLGNGKTISIIDAIGVNMAATKELSRDMKSLRKQIQTRGVVE